MSCKYLVMSNGEHGCEYAVVFGETESHVVIAHRLGGTDKVLGAGMVSIGTGIEGQHMVSCYGESITLKKKSRGSEDAFFVVMALFGSTGDVDY